MAIRTALIGLLLTWGQQASADLLWGFGPLDGMPYVAVREQQLTGGFTRLLGERVGRELAMSVRFIETPNNRLEGFLQDGRIQVICNANPEWMSQANRLHWSAPLYQEEDALLQHTQPPAFTDLASLHGKTLGTSLGFVYSPPLMAAFADGSVQRKDFRDLDTRLHMLSLRRLDALIDMRRTLTYRLARNPELPVRFSTWVVQRYWMHCAYGPHLEVAAEQLDQVLLKLRERGEIDTLLEQAARESY